MGVSPPPKKKQHGPRTLKWRSSPPSAPLLLGSHAAASTVVWPPGQRLWQPGQGYTASGSVTQVIMDITVHSSHPVE